MGNASVVFRLGSVRDDALTPRPGKDTSAVTGQKPGLSVFLEYPLDRRAQKIEVSRLAGSGLRYFPDDPTKGGESNHGVIAPEDAFGEVDQALLDEWASYRGSAKRHRFTQAIIDALIE